MENAKEIMKRLEKLEERARYNRDKWDDTPLTEWLSDEEKEEYKKLIELWNKIVKGDKE